MINIRIEFIINKKRGKKLFYFVFNLKQDFCKKVEIKFRETIDSLIPYHVALFHELTHFSDVLDTDDNYDYSSGIIPEDVPKLTRLKTAQCWQYFYSYCF